MKKINRPLLEFNNVTVLKGRNEKVLNSISIKIYEGENVVILGPNGAGKSSFIKAITREYYPLLNKKNSLFRIWGQDRWNIFDLRFLLGIVSNDLQSSCAKDISGMNLVLSGFFSSIGLYKERVTSKMKNKAEKVIEFLEISRLKDRNMNEMSSGEARRFLIARALVHNPKALILDEPTTSLDLHSLYKFCEMLRKISRSGTSIILVTQNLSDIIPEINRAILMKEGRFYKDGVKEDILTGKNISGLFNVPVEIRKKNGYYYAFRGQF